MEELRGLIPVWRQIFYKWKSFRNVPFRKRFFVGYDLSGNTYWEFFLEKRRESRPRRIYKPLVERPLMHDYLQGLPVQWIQWLRYTRSAAPSLKELVDDQKRVERLKTLTYLKDQNFEHEKEVTDGKIMESMMKELEKVASSADTEKTNIKPRKR